MVWNGNSSKLKLYIRKHMRLPRYYLLFGLFGFLSLLSVSCKNGSPENKILDRPAVNSIYFWKTRFELNDYEQSFLKEHEVRRMYVRFFDVDDDEAGPYAQLNRIVPVATTQFVTSKPDSVEIVPTVFLTVRAISYIEHSVGGSREAAQKIVRRVLNMADYNDMGPVKEVQLDCDWTESTQNAYFSLCKEVGALLHEEGILLSSTIRLHQLRTAAPPVDCGVLMLYNTGSLQSVSETNSIISRNNVAKYIHNRKVDYYLPLDFAYPTYRWGLVFRGGHFSGILHKSDYSDQTLYTPQGDGTYRVAEGHEVDGEYLSRGMHIRVEDAPIATILEVKGIVEKAFPDTHHSTIIYHLDSLNLTKYTPDEITSIYSN